MQLNKKRLIPFVLALIISAAPFLQPHAAVALSSSPEQVYHRAWQIIKDNYVDPSFHQQDWETWHHKFDGKLQTDAQSYDAIKEMLASLDDQYTRFLDPQAFKEEGDAINSFVCGIGISLKPYAETHALIVNDVIDGGPAAKAGMEYGDQIVSIDGQSSDGVDVDKAAEKIRGIAGTSVELTIKRDGERSNLHLTRAQVCIPSVSSKMLDGNIGYIKLSTFMADDAAAEFRSALRRLDGARGLVIDLRDNPGGLLANAVEIADMILPSGKIVTTESRHGRSTSSAGSGMLTDQPIVLLCDKDSASASEILAGALKDNGRATIVGTRTYGKGLVQCINRLPDGSGIHVTVARYYTPNGSNINKVGIQPDVSVSDHERQLGEAVAVLNSAIAQHQGEPSAALGRRFGFSPRVLSPRT